MAERDPKDKDARGVREGRRSFAHQPDPGEVERARQMAIGRDLIEQDKEILAALAK